MAMKNKTKGKITNPGLPSVSNLVKVNDNDAGSIYNDLLAKSKKIEYESRDIALANIRTNPDNEIFRSLDDEEDIRILADDIKRNGMLHNIVVYPEKKDGKTVYVLLSGERRFRALNLLQEEGDATWNIVRNCNVAITPLTENEKRVLLYSANLQIRGGFADESIRRKAIAEFINCLQKEPYNMSRAEALSATKSVSAIQPKTIERDAKIEYKLNDEIKALLDNKFLTRSECEIYLRFEDEKQRLIADRYTALFNVDCHRDENEGAGKNYVEVLKDNLHDAYRELLFNANTQTTSKAYDEAFEKSNLRFDEDYLILKTKAEEFAKVKGTASKDDLDAVNYEERKEAAKEFAKKEKLVEKTKSSIVQKSVPKMVKKLSDTYRSRTFGTALKTISEQSRNADIAALTELIEVATKLRDKIESADRS